MGHDDSAFSLIFDYVCVCVGFVFYGILIRPFFLISYWERKSPGGRNAARVSCLTLVYLLEILSLASIITGFPFSRPTALAVFLLANALFALAAQRIETL